MECFFIFFLFSSKDSFVLQYSYPQQYFRMKKKNSTVCFVPMFIILNLINIKHVLKKYHLILYYFIPICVLLNLSVMYVTYFTTVLP